MNEIRWPTKEELIEAAEKGTVIWWERVDESWIFYIANGMGECVYNHLCEVNPIKALWKIYDRILCLDEAMAILRIEAPLFEAPFNWKFWKEGKQ